MPPMMPPILPALATGLALLLYVVLSINVSRARGRYNVLAPAAAGDPAFERVFRVHQNTLEQLVVFLPSLWLFSYFVSPIWGGGIGFLWVLARIFYAWSYYRDAASRGPGFVISIICSLALLIGSIGGMLRAF
jgi:glutathione S-transferase